MLLEEIQLLELKGQHNKSQESRYKSSNLGSFGLDQEDEKELISLKHQI